MREMKDSGVEWLGEVPSRWKLHRAKRLFKLTNDRGNDDLTLLAATQKHGMWPQDRLEGVVRVKDDTDLSRFRTVHRNDFVISLRSFQGGFERSDFEGVCSPAYQTFRSIKPIDYQFYKYLFKSPSFIDHMNSLTLGIREGKTIKFEDFAAQVLPMPPLDEQRRIAEYLDDKCAEIDRAVSTAEQSIEEYRAYQNDVVKRAIVYGTCNAFKVKESGVPAIGKMNANWGLVMVKRLAVFLNGDRSDSYPSGDDIQEAGIPFITSGDLNGRYLPDVFSKYISQDKYDSLKGVKLRRGDVVFCLRGSVGKCSLNRTENCGTVASSLTVARPICCAPEWLSYALTCSSTTNQAMATAIGATSANLVANVLARAFVPLPPLSEQRLIADYLDEKCTQIDADIAAKQAIITDLKAYKQSLIYETVTGKREV